MYQARVKQKIIILLILSSLLVGIQISSVNSFRDVWAADLNPAQKTLMVGWDESAPFLDVTHQMLPSNEFSQEKANLFRVQLYNSGDVAFKEITVALALPDGLSFGNTSNVETLDSMMVGDRKAIGFPIRVDRKAETKSYAIAVAVDAKGYQGQSWSSTRTFYVPVKGSAAFSDDDLAISNIALPTSVAAEQDFELTFQVKNTGSIDAGRLKISVEGGEGLVNKSRNIFFETRLEKGSSKNYSVFFHAMKSETPKSGTIKITVEPDESTGDAKDTNRLTQYATVFVSGSKGSAKKLQLVVDQYSFGGKSVQAGSEFTLHLRLRNTANTALANIKAAINAENNAFIPVGGSNSFYVDSIGPNGFYEKSLRLSSNPQSDQKPSPITLALTYEDGSGNTYEASEIISVPVVQDIRLAYDEPVGLVECYVGQPSGAEVQFYNIGKGPLYNLRVNATGNFDTMESNRYYVGNLESGKSDSYSFQFIPREAGNVEGVVTFTYENIAGEPQSREMAFSFPVNEMPVAPGEMGEVPQENGLSLKAKLLIAGGMGGGFLLAILLWFLRRKKKKQNLMLELDDI